MALLTQPYSGVGTTLSYRTSLSGSGAYTVLGLLADDFDFGPITRAITEINLIGLAYVTKVANRQNAGDINGTLYFVDGDAGVSEMWALSQSGAMVSWQIQVPDGSSPTTGTTYVGSGMVSSYAGTGFSGADVPMAPFTIAITGLWIRTLGS